MTGTRSMLAFAMLLAIGCTPKEYDSASSSPSSKSAQNGGASVNGADHKNDGKSVTADQVVEKTKEALESAGALAAKSKDEFVAEAKQRLAEMDQKIEEWEAESKPVAEDARTKWEHEREVLRERRTQMQQELDKLKNASGDAWQDMKQGATAEWKELADAFRKAEVHIKEEQEK